MITEEAARKKAKAKPREKNIRIVSLRMVKEASLRDQYGVVASPADIPLMVKELVGSSDREHFGVVCIDTKNQPTHISIVSVGTLNASMVHPREVFKIAIISNSASIIAFHNHPSGNANPSGTDLEITERLAEAGRIIGIELLDHIIVSDAGYLSMREKRMI